MLEFMNNELGVCFFVFIMIVSLLWYTRSSIFFNEDGTAKSTFGQQNGLNLSLFGMCVIILAIIIYYVFAMFKYNY